MASAAVPPETPTFAVAVVRLWREPDGAVRVRLLWRDEHDTTPTPRTFADPAAALAALRADVDTWVRGDGPVTLP